MCVETASNAGSLNAYIEFTVLYQLAQKCYS